MLFGNFGMKVCFLFYASASSMQARDIKDNRQFFVGDLLHRIYSQTVYEKIKEKSLTESFLMIWQSFIEK